MLDKTLPILPIVRPTFPPLEAISERFSECLRTGQVTNGGRYVEEFEAALTEYLGVPTICFSSGMAALVAMLMAEGVHGRDVITPSFTFCATPHAIKLAGGNPIFADIDEDTLTLDPYDVDRKMTRLTTAIVGVDVFGICCDYDDLFRVANKNTTLQHKIAVHYDSAPAFGSLVQGKPTGHFGRSHIFSFHATKPFSVGGEGGCLCSHDESFIAEAKEIRNFGQPHRLGFNGKMQEINALIGLEQLDGFPRKMANRVAAANYFMGALEGIDGVTTFNPVHSMPVWTYYPCLIDKDRFGVSRDDLMSGLLERGIETRRYYPAMHLNEAYWPSQRVKLPVTERIASQIISLPVYNDMSPHECERIAAAIMEMSHG
jgi:dTDP-4-amino-4,6-dideoxyglucose